MHADVTSSARSCGSVAVRGRIPRLSTTAFGSRAEPRARRQSPPRSHRSRRRGPHKRLGPSPSSGAAEAPMRSRHPARPALGDAMGRDPWHPYERRNRAITRCRARVDRAGAPSRASASPPTAEERAGWSTGACGGRWRVARAPRRSPPHPRARRGEQHRATLARFAGHRMA